MKIILVGYMGSGKSIVARELGKYLNMHCEELDVLIEKSEGSTIKSIFLKKGELFFRKLEHQLFKKLVCSDNNLIISTGGGTPCYYDNYKFLQGNNCKSVYLKASIETLFSRLQFNKQNRPLLQNIPHTAAKEFIAKHLFERSYYYNQAMYTIDVNNKNVHEIVLEIKSLLM